MTTLDPGGWGSGEPGIGISLPGEVKDAVLQAERFGLPSTLRYESPTQVRRLDWSHARGDGAAGAPFSATLCPAPAITLASSTTAPKLGACRQLEAAGAAPAHEMNFNYEILSLKWPVGAHVFFRRRGRVHSAVHAPPAPVDFSQTGLLTGPSLTNPAGFIDSRKR